MEKETTKYKILIEALKLFSKYGYEAVTVEQIADAVGIKAPSLYKHYKSKRDIFDCILRRMEELDEIRAKEYGMPENIMEGLSIKNTHASIESIRMYSEAQFLYWTEDEFASAFRKMLTIEQYKSEEMSDLYYQYISIGPLNYMSDIFGQITGNKEKGKMLAVEFYSPMFLCYSLYDAAKDSIEKQNVINILKTNIENK